MRSAKSVSFRFLFASAAFFSIFSIASSFACFSARSLRISARFSAYFAHSAIYRKLLKKNVMSLFSRQTIFVEKSLKPMLLNAVLHVLLFQPLVRGVHRVGFALQKSSLSQWAILSGFMKFFHPQICLGMNW